jgi:hypothetical protein
MLLFFVVMVSSSAAAAAVVKASDADPSVALAAPVDSFCVGDAVDAADAAAVADGGVFFAPFALEEVAAAAVVVVVEFDVDVVVVVIMSMTSIEVRSMSSCTSKALA